jgi:ATP-dependent DNA ligase
MIGSVNHNSFFCDTIFTRQVRLDPSRFIKAMHPKSEIRPDGTAIERILAAGWVGQLKIHGHRAQIHISADPAVPLIAYTRQGKRHTKELPETMVKEIRRLFRPTKGWTAIDAEWLKPKNKLFVFDLLKLEDRSLRALAYPDRWSMLPRAFISPHVSVLPLLRDLPSCLKQLRLKGEHIEGLVFKSATSIGFSDTSIVRCRKRP